MTSLFKTLSRRWLLAILGLAALLFGVAMLHAYSRQSLFGPTIRGKPRCVWEAEVRRFGNRPEPFAAKLLRWLGIDQQNLSWSEVFDHTEMAPLVVEMLEDRDPDVRLEAMKAIWMCPDVRDRSALPALRRLLNDNRHINRLMAARSIWAIDRDQHVLPVLLELSKHNDSTLRNLGVMFAAEIACEGPDLFAHVIQHATDADSNIRTTVMIGLKAFGKKGVPTLINGLRDSSVSVRQAAINSLEVIGPDAADAIPALQARLNDADVIVRATAPLALQAIDRERFRHLKGWRK